LLFPLDSRAPLFPFSWPPFLIHYFPCPSSRRVLFLRKVKDHFSSPVFFFSQILSDFYEVSPISVAKNARPLDFSAVSVLFSFLCSFFSLSSLVCISVIPASCLSFHMSLRIPVLSVCLISPSLALTPEEVAACLYICTPSLFMFSPIAHGPRISPPSPAAIPSFQGSLCKPVFPPINAVPPPPRLAARKPYFSVPADLFLPLQPYDIVPTQSLFFPQADRRDSLFLFPRDSSTAG